jgi:transposase
MNAWNPDARRKAEVILKVRAGLMSVTEAAKQLGVSRKTYYKWERRALEGMVVSLCERSPGRPSGESDAEQKRMTRRIRELERELDKEHKAGELRERIKQLPEKKE